MNLFDLDKQKSFHGHNDTRKEARNGPKCGRKMDTKSNSILRFLQTGQHSSAGKYCSSIGQPGSLQRS